MATNRPPFFVSTVGLAAPGPITVAGVQVGDIILAFNMTDLTTPPAIAFEKNASVAGQVQQASATNFSAKTILWLIIPQGWTSIQA